MYWKPTTNGNAWRQVSKGIWTVCRRKHAAASCWDVRRLRGACPYTFGRAVYDIGRNDGSHMETGHAGRVELPTPAETGNHLTPYLYGTDKE